MPACWRTCARRTRWSPSCSTGGSTPSSRAPTSTRCRRSSTRSPTGCTRPSTRPSRRPAACRRPTRTSRTSPSGPSSGGGSGARSWPAAPTRVLMAADYSQIELRILAHVSRRRAPARRRSSGARTSIARPPRACCTRSRRTVTADERSMAKMVNFGLAYGMSDFGLASRAGIPRAGGPGVHQQLLRGLQRASPTT